MSESDWHELKAAIADGSFEKAGLRALLRYDRAIKDRAAHEVPPAIRDQLQVKITQKVITTAVVTLIIASIVGGLVSWLTRLLSAG
ncbi:MAG: hypothetical protein ACM3SP_05020 [Chloroflexota bacterium]